MASLSEQLAAVRSLDAARLGATGARAQPSYLFAPRQAAQQTTADIHAIGHNGFLALLPKDAEKQAAWNALEEELFGERAKQLDRTLLDKAANDKLDGHLHALLRLLGPSVLLRPCGQVLEWLVRRFRIHEFNVRAVLALFLPYHETPQFVQMLQLLKIEDDTLFASLAPTKSAQQVLPRQIIVQLMTKSTDLLRYITTLLPQAINTQTSHRALIALWTTTLVAFLEHKRNVAPGEMAILLPALLDVMRKGEEDSKLAAYIVVARLSAKVTFTDDALNTIVTRLTQSRAQAQRLDELAPAENDEAMLGTLAIVCAEQEELARMPDKAIAAFLQVDEIEALLVKLAASCDMVKVLRPLTHSLVTGVAQGGQQHADLLSHLLHNVNDSIIRTTALESLFAAATADAESLEHCLPLISIIFQRSPAVFEVVSAKMMQSDLLQQIVARVAGLDGDEDLLTTGVGGDSSAIRILGLRKLLADESASPERVREQLLLHLRQYDVEVTSAIFESGLVLNKLEADDLLNVARSLFAKSDAPRAVLTLWSSFLATVFLEKHADRANEVVLTILWPKLLFGKASKKSVAAVYAALKGSRLAKSGVVAGLPDFIIDSSASQNQVIVERLAQNLLSSPPTLHTRVKQLLEHVNEAGSSSLLARWVLLSLAKAAGQSLPAPVMGDIMLALFMQGICAAGGAATEADLPADLVEAVYSKPSSSKTAGRLEAHMLVALFASLSKPSEVIPWLKPNEDTEDAAANFRKAAGIAYQLARAVAGASTASKLLQSLFAALGADGPLFLLTGAIRSDWSIALRVLAIRDAVAMLEAVDSEPLASLIAAIPLLQDSDRRIRQESVKLFAAVGQRLSQNGSTVSSSIYGADVELAQLSAADAEAYLRVLVEQEGNIVIDAAGLASAHRSLDSALKRNVLSFYLSHAAATQDAWRRLQLLEALDQVTSKHRLASSMTLLRDVETTVDQLKPEQAERYLALLFSAFDKPGKALENSKLGVLALLQDTIAGRSSESMQRHTVRVLQHSVYSHVGAEQKVQLLQAVVESLAGNASAVPSELRKCGIALVQQDPSAVKTYLDSLNTALAPVDRTESGASKKAKTDVNVPKSNIIACAATLLELLEHETGATNLLTPLFTLISRFTDLAGSEYVLFAAQRAVLAISGILAKVEQPSSLAHVVRADIIVNLLKVNPSPSLAQRTLLLLSQLTDIVSTQIIPHVMPIFTFIGHNLLQRDDASSMRVIEQTIDSIIPPLVRSARTTATERKPLVLGLRDVIGIFTSASIHVPRHKRVPVYSRLAAVLGPHDFLGAVITLLCEQQIAKVLKAEGNDANLRDALDLPLAVLASFPPRHQLTALLGVLEEVLNLAKDKSIPAERQTLVSITAKATIRRHIVTLTSLLRLALGSKQLISKVDSSRAQGYQDVDVGLQELARELMHGMSHPEITLPAAEGADLTTRLRVILQSLVALTAPSVFSEVILWHADSPSLPVLLNALALLRQQLPNIKQTKRKDVSPAVNAILRRLSSLFAKAGAENAKQTPEMLQAVAVLASSSVSEEHVALSGLVPVLLEMGGRPSLHSRVANELLTCLATFPSALGARLLPQLKALSTFAVGFLSGKEDSASFAQNQTAAYALLAALVESLPSFIGPALRLVLRVVLDTSGDVTARDRFLQSVARLVPASSLVPVLAELWPELSTARTPALLAYLSLLQKSIRATKPDGLVNVYKALFRLFLVIFDLRRESKDIDAEDLAAVEKAGVGAFIQLVLKLSDNAFRPLFLRLVDWALVDLADESADQVQDRAIVLFRLMDRMLAQLKEVISPYFAYVLDPSIDILERQTGEAPSSLGLWDLVASSLTHALLHGVDGYWTSTRLQRLIAPCVDQLKSASQFGPSRTSSLVGPLVAQLAVTSAEHEVILKAVNTAILARMRDDSDETAQIASIRTLDSVWQALGETMSIHVPETLPIILECLEAEPAVERATRVLIKTMETTMGESLLEQI